MCLECIQRIIRMVTFSELPQFTMRGHGGGVTLLMLVTGILVILAAILPQAENTLFFGSYCETFRML